MIICNRCKKHFQQIESHHVWCKFMDNPHGLTWKEYPNRFDLCFNCHKALHQIIIIPLLNDIAELLKSNGSEYWLWKNISPTNKDYAIEEVCKSTLKFIMEYEDGNTKTISE